MEKGNFVTFRLPEFTSVVDGLPAMSDKDLIKARNELIGQGISYDGKVVGKISNLIKMGKRKEVDVLCEIFDFEMLEKVRSSKGEYSMTLGVGEVVGENGEIKGVK